ncbi:hypothetical protein STEG23_021405 [Scotinomys teguina]
MASGCSWVPGGDWGSSEVEIEDETVWIASKLIWFDHPRPLSGPMEPFSDFVARLVDAAGRIFGDPDAAMPLIKQLVYEQYTKECRVAITPYKAKGLEVWMKGMANSPTMCQLFVAAALEPLRTRFPNLRCLHYMDNILLAAKEESILQEAYCSLVQLLKEKGLCVAPEKVQQSKVVNNLGSKITSHCVVPQKVALRKDHLCTLNDFQKLLGDINWIIGSLQMANYELKPLYDILVGDAALDSPRQLTSEARVALSKIEDRLQKAFLQRVQNDQDIILCILPTLLQPTGILWQKGPLLWIHTKISPAKSMEYYPAAVALLAQQGIQQCLQHFGTLPKMLIIPYDSNQVKILCATTDDWAILRCTYAGHIDCHYPKHPLLNFFKEHPVIFPKITASQPIAEASVIFTDGSKTGCGAYMVDAGEPMRQQFSPGAPQQVELSIVLEVFKACSFAFNLVLDSSYVVNALKSLECAGLIKSSSPDQQDPVWVPERLTRRIQHAATKDDADCPDNAPGVPIREDGIKMGNIVGIPEANARFNEAMEAEDFTIFIKNSIQFPLFNFEKGNLLPNLTAKDIKTCRFHPEKAPFCPILRVGDVVKFAGQDFAKLAWAGGVLGIKIGWVCDPDKAWDQCIPKYSFTRLDGVSEKSNVSTGYNFRFAKYYKTENGSEYRTLLKAFGIRFDVLVYGNAGKLNIIPTIISSMAAFTSVGVGTVLCDIILLSFLKGADHYKARKSEEVNATTLKGTASTKPVFPSDQATVEKQSTDSGADSISH